MKNKITLLVTTDFSANSKSAIHFALQLASQTPCNLVFFHALELIAPTGWSKEEANQFVNTEVTKTKADLDKFLQQIFKKTGGKVPTYQYDVERAINVDSHIVGYAQKINADYICMSTRGAGTLKKLIGTNASTLVNTSPIPVIAVPKRYRTKPITKVAYASDLEDIDKELSIVKHFALPLKALIDVYHYNYKLQDIEAKEEVMDVISKHQSEIVAFYVPELHLEYTLVENIQKAVKKNKPSMLIMFTKQKKNWFEKFFFDSKTAQMTYDINIPLLAIRKS